MFNKCNKLKEIKGLNKLNTNKVIKMNSMFQLCTELEYLDLSNFDTSNVTDMSYMFNECYKLKEIKGINKFNTNNVTNMAVMFQSCKKLESLDLSNFNTSNVTDMSNMFEKCSNLKQIKGIANFDTTKVNAMNNIFNGCKKLQYFDFSGSLLNNNSNNNNNGLIAKFNEQIKKNLNLKNEKDSENKKESVFFVSDDEIINCSISFENFDIFSILENKLYVKYPDLKNKNIIFFFNGYEINRTSTLEDNGIKNGDIILLKEIK
jgi:surface protein